MTDKGMSPKSLSPENLSPGNLSIDNALHGLEEFLRDRIAPAIEDP